MLKETGRTRERERERKTCSSISWTTRKKKTSEQASELAVWKTRKPPKAKRKPFFFPSHSSRARTHARVRFLFPLIPLQPCSRRRCSSSSRWKRGLPAGVFFYVVCELKGEERSEEERERRRRRCRRRHWLKEKKLVEDFEKKTPFPRLESLTGNTHESPRNREDAVGSFISQNI